MVPVADMKPVWVTLIIATALMLSARTAFAETPAKVPSVTAATNGGSDQLGTTEHAPDIRGPEVIDPDIQDVEVEIRVPEVEAPDVQVPEVETPEVQVPEMNLPEVEIPESH
jgi:hypothetical protein